MLVASPENMISHPHPEHANLSFSLLNLLIVLQYPHYTSFPQIIVCSSFSISFSTFSSSSKSNESSAYSAWHYGQPKKLLQILHYRNEVTNVCGQKLNGFPRLNFVFNIYY